MALFAWDQEGLIDAWDAERGGRYWCLECGAPVKVRRGKYRFPHFYHLQISRRCHLYSKSEDHLLLQLQLQRHLPDGETAIERPFLEINRVADLAWEKKKIIFEIQCSSLLLPEAEARTREYKTAGYQVVWLLDDRIFNKRQLRPAEAFLRTHSAYFFSFRRHGSSLYYDQFEILINQRRLKKGGRLFINPRRVLPLSTPPSFDLPRQIFNRLSKCSYFFHGDLLYRAVCSPTHLFFAISLQNWRALEIHFAKMHQKPSKIKKFWHHYLRNPYLQLLDALLEKTH